jgi:hypothetical protein
MRKLFFLLLSLLCLQSSGQNYLKNLSVTITDSFNKKASITVGQLKDDPLLVTDALKNALVSNGFKVISEQTSNKQIELSNQKVKTDSTLNQSMTLGSKEYINSIYYLTIHYNFIHNGFGSSISDFYGQITDLLNDGQIVVTFSYQEKGLGRNTLELMQSLVKTINNKSK